MVVVVLFCGGGSVVVVVLSWWFCYGDGVVVVVNWWLCCGVDSRLLVNMKNYKVVSLRIISRNGGLAPPIPSPVNLPSRYDVPKYVDRHFNEHQRIIKELQQKNDAQEKMLKEVYNFYKPMSYRYPTSYPSTPHIATPMAQQVFSLWSSTNQAGPSQQRDVGGVNPVEELMYMGSRAIDVYISLHNVDHTKFWRELVPYLCKGAISTGSNLDYIGWLSDDQINCGVELMIRARPHGAQYTMAKTGTSSMLKMSGRIPSLIDHISKWTNVLNVLLEKVGHFERTGRRPYNFELVYNQGLGFVSPQQGNCSDCRVVTCWVIENLYEGQASLLYHFDPVIFFSAIRVDLALRLYDCRCEDTTECGYD
nr:hypothetical protein [Tanacetum cinerariifolium]